MNTDIVLIDLFSGIGGFAKGLKEAGFNITHHYFSEIDKKAIAVYKYHFKNSEYVGSVIDVSGTEIRRKHPGDIIIGTWGFPCQDLSVAGKRKGLKGKRSGLFYEAVRVLKESEVDISIFENVYGLISSNNGKDIESVIDELYTNGFIVDFDEMNTIWYLPQNRRRIYGVTYNIKSILKWVISDTSGQKKRLGIYMKIMEGYLQSQLLKSLTDHTKLLSIREMHLASEQNLKEIKKSLSGSNLKSKYLKIIKTFPLESLQSLFQDTQNLLSKLQGTNGSYSQKESLKDTTLTDIKLEDTNGTRKQKEADLYLSIEQLWQSLSEEHLPLLNKYIILILIKQITPSKIWSYVEMQECIELFIIQLNLLYPDCLNWAFCRLIEKKTFTKYATNRKIKERDDEKRDNTSLFQFPNTRNSEFTCPFGCSGEECCRQILPVREGNGQASDKENKGHLSAGTISTKNQSPHAQFDGSTALIGCLNKNGQLSEMAVDTAIDASYHKGMDNHGQRTMVLCDSGTGRKLQERDNVAPLRANTGAGHGNYIEVGTLRTHKDGEGFRKVKDGNCPTIQARAREDGSGQPVIEEFIRQEMPHANSVTPDAYLTTGKRKRDENGKAVLTSMHERRIRRLTETECELLQGFPKNWTQFGIENDQVITISATQRYKQCGNAVSVPVVKAVGERILSDMK